MTTLMIPAMIPATNDEFIPLNDVIHSENPSGLEGSGSGFAANPTITPKKGAIASFTNF